MAFNGTQSQNWDPHIQPAPETYAALHPGLRFLIACVSRLSDGLEPFPPLAHPHDLEAPADARPLIIAPSAVFNTAPSPNAARLFQELPVQHRGQQGLVDASGLCSFHRLVKEKAGWRPLSTIKLIKSDPEAMEAHREDIKARYRSIFGA